MRLQARMQFFFQPCNKGFTAYMYVYLYFLTNVIRHAMLYPSN